MEDLLFFAGIIVIWYLVGREIDSRTSPKGEMKPNETGGKLWRNVLLILLGIYLLVVSAANYRNPGGKANIIGATANNILFLAWSMVLIFLPGLQLFNRIRAGGPDEKS